MDSASLPPEVAKLLAYGAVFAPEEWPDYVSTLGLRQEHVDALISLATDRTLIQGEAESVEASAPVHAWRALGQLRAVAAVVPLLELFELPDAPWVTFEIPTVMAAIGPPAIPALAARLASESRDELVKFGAILSLTEIARRSAESRDEVVSILSTAVRRYRDNDIATNAYLAKALCDLGAKEALPIIRDVYLHQRAALDIFTWDQVLDALEP